MLLLATEMPCPLLCPLKFPTRTEGASRVICCLPPASGRRSCRGSAIRFADMPPSFLGPKSRVMVIRHLLQIFTCGGGACGSGGLRLDTTTSTTWTAISRRSMLSCGLVWTDAARELLACLVYSPSSEVVAAAVSFSGSRCHPTAGQPASQFIRTIGAVPVGHGSPLRRAQRLQLLRAYQRWQSSEEMVTLNEIASPYEHLALWLRVFS